MTSLDQIAAQLQGYDPQALPIDTATQFLMRLAQPATLCQRVALKEALGCVLADDVISPVHVPPHDNSAMDGYAFAGAQLHNTTPLTLRNVGTTLAGQAWNGAIGAGQCIKITTGAVMPQGLDTVVPVELVEHAGEQITIPAGAVRAGDNRRRKGEDILSGSVALHAGSHIGPAALGLLASLGLPEVPVRRALRVAYFSTGNEILSLGEPPREGAVYDSNRFTVFGMLRQLGVEVIDLGVVRDDPGALQAAVTQAASQADAIITSGGVSVGDADHTKAVLEKLGTVAFWKIAMRPGRPMAIGQIARPPSDPNAPQPPVLMFGLPGNPVAVMVTFLALVRPALLRMMGSTAPAPLLLKAHSTETIRKKPGRTEYQRGIVSTRPDGALQVHTTGNQGSGVLSSMVQANSLIVLSHTQGNVAVGDQIDVLLLSSVL